MRQEGRKKTAMGRGERGISHLLQLSRQKRLFFHGEDKKSCSRVPPPFQGFAFGGGYSRGKKNGVMMRGDRS